MKRSTDGGPNSLNNPTVVQERARGRVFLWYQRIPGHLKEHSDSTATGPDGTNIYRNLVLTSDDDGLNQFIEQTGVDELIVASAIYDHAAAHRCASLWAICWRNPRLNSKLTPGTYRNCANPSTTSTAP